MQLAKCLTESTNARRFVEKVTHRYHSVDALHFFHSRRRSLGQCLYSQGGWGFCGRVRELRAWTRGLSWRWKEEWKDLYRLEARSATSGTFRSL
jgi:hypothetical protein